MIPRYGHRGRRCRRGWRVLRPLRVRTILSDPDAHRPGRRGRRPSPGTRRPGRSHRRHDSPVQRGRCAREPLRINLPPIPGSASTPCCCCGHAAPIVALCCWSPPVRPRPGESSPPTGAQPAPPRRGADPTTAAPTTTCAFAGGLRGTWTFGRVTPASSRRSAVTRARIASRNRTVHAGEYSSEGSIEFSGDEGSWSAPPPHVVSRACAGITSSCRGQLVILNAGMLTPLGAFGDNCGWVDVPRAAS